MALILNIETATKVCSVSLAKNGLELKTIESNSESYSHSENLNLFIESLFQDTVYSLKNIDAVSVSKGPGSYTGLRIGVSTAKGICYALSIPLISINSLQSLASLKKFKNSFICPMFDARRMEVYSLVLNEDLIPLSETAAVIIEDESYKSYLDQKEVVFLGPGAEKCMNILKHENAIFDLETRVSARGMIGLSEAKFNQGDFEGLAYFEPFYLKEFIAGPPKKML